MRVGFTGTRTGMSAIQREQLRELLSDIEVARFTLMRATSNLPDLPDEFHFGDCIGADAEAAEMARGFKFVLHAHPPSNPKFRARLSADVVYPEKGYFARNRDIVDAVTVLIAAPKTFAVPSGGTWATIRYAMRVIQDDPARLKLHVLAAENMKTRMK